MGFRQTDLQARHRGNCSTLPVVTTIVVACYAFIPLLLLSRLPELLFELNVTGQKDRRGILEISIEEDYTQADKMGLGIFFCLQ